MTLQSVSCTTGSFSGISSAICEISSNVINIKGTFSINSNIRVVVSGFNSPKRISTLSTTIATYDTLDYEIDTSSSIQYTTLCSLPCRTCQKDQPLLCLSCY
jgi:hypothetical protein